MNYIMRSTTGIIVSSDKIDEFDSSLKKYVNQLCEKELRDVDSIQRIIKKKYKIKSNIPILINRNICFMLTKSIRKYDVKLINICEIFNVRECKKLSKITFMNGEVLDVEMPYLLMRKRLSQVRSVLDDNICK